MREQFRLVKQQLDDSTRIFELYLFINPLGKQCYQCEKELMRFVQHAPYKVHVHFIAFHNFQTVSNVLLYQGRSQTNLQARNQIFMDTFDATLAYKAASLQGKRLGRLFLITLQKKVSIDGVRYNANLLDQIVTEIGLDKKMFYEDKQSTHILMDYEQDRRIAHEMNIQATPSLVIFDNHNNQYGILINNGITASNIASMCMEADALLADRFSLSTQHHSPASVSDITYLQSF